MSLLVEVRYMGDDDAPWNGEWETVEATEWVGAIRAFNAQQPSDEDDGEPRVAGDCASPDGPEVYEVRATVTAEIHETALGTVCGFPDADPGVYRV